MSSGSPVGSATVKVVVIVPSLAIAADCTAIFRPGFTNSTLSGRKYALSCGVYICLWPRVGSPAATPTAKHASAIIQSFRDRICLKTTLLVHADIKFAAAAQSCTTQDSGVPFPDFSLKKLLLQRMNVSDNVVEVGSGNGRDRLHFAGACSDGGLNRVIGLRAQRFHGDIHHLRDSRIAGAIRAMAVLAFGCIYRFAVLRTCGCHRGQHRYTVYNGTARQ